MNEKGRCVKFENHSPIQITYRNVNRTTHCQQQVNLQLTTYNLQLTTYNLQLTTYYLLLTTYYLQFTTYYLPTASQLTTYYLQLTNSNPQKVILTKKPHHKPRINLHRLVSA